MNKNFSYIYSDSGYKVMYDNININKIIPIKADIEPRLVYFLRTLYYHKKYNFRSCIPLYMQFHIKNIDWDEIIRYINKYKIWVFYK